jgi:Family of unknown function (DUF6152)
MKPRVVLAATLLALLSGAAFAHHSFAMFDQDKEVKLVGTIKEVQWTNPHIWVQVMAPNPANGQMVEWSIEGGSPNGLSRQGWRRNSLKAGDKVEITIHPLKNGENGGSLMKVLVDGKPVGNRPA